MCSDGALMEAAGIPSMRGACFSAMARNRQGTVSLGQAEAMETRQMRRRGRREKGPTGSLCWTLLRMTARRTHPGRAVGATQAAAPHARSRAGHTRTIGRHSHQAAQRRPTGVVLDSTSKQRSSSRTIHPGTFVVAACSGNSSGLQQAHRLRPLLGGDETRKGGARSMAELVLTGVQVLRPMRRGARRASIQPTGASSPLTTCLESADSSSLASLN